MTATPESLGAAERGVWWTAPDTGDVIIAGVRAVLADRVLDDAVVVCQDGVIAEITQTSRRPTGALDGRGALLLPGLVDVHSDALEGELTPRPNTEFPLEFALRAFEQRLLGFGVTTVCDGVGFQDNAQWQRTLDRAERLCAALAERQADPAALVNHLVLHRIDTRSPDSVTTMQAHLPAALPNGVLPLVSAEDHTPGQGQFRDLDRFIRARMKEGMDEATARATVAARIEQRDELLHHQERNVAALTAMAADDQIRLIIHDPETAADVAGAAERGVKVVEFPLTMAAAAEARRRDMPVVLGAPNVIRGGSHSGNVAAEEVLAAGLCTSLASDYQPAALLEAAFLLAGRKVIDLPAAVSLLTAGPADAAGLHDRGRLATGQRGDLILVGVDSGWPRPLAVHRAPIP